jgi:hypothetical protein
MARTDQLLNAYRKQVSMPLRPGLALNQRVWFVVYPPEEERRLALRLPEFEMATTETGLEWVLIDLQRTLADWIDTFDDDTKNTCLETPEILEDYARPEYIKFLSSRINQAVANVPDARRAKTVFALRGLMELFDFIHVSDLVADIDTQLTGILVVFFPGEREDNTYRFLGARTGWDYLAVPISAES